MDITQMKYVLAVAKYRSFTLAAESCYISQSSLSLQIAALEKELGVRLFERTTRSIRVTEAGSTFVEMATGILAGVDALGQTMSSYTQFLRGTLNIGCITSLETIHFSDMITNFYSRYPNLTLNIYQGKSVTILEDLEKHAIDVAIVALPPDASYPGVRFTEMGGDSYTLVVPESHRLSHKETVNIAELKDERFILHHPDQTISRICMKSCTDAGFTPNVVCRVGASSIAISLVRSGLGICFLPTEECNYYNLIGTRQLRLETPLRKQIVMGIRAKDDQSYLLKTFLAFVAEYQARINRHHA